MRTRHTGNPGSLSRMRCDSKRDFAMNSVYDTTCRQNAARASCRPVCHRQATIENTASTWGSDSPCSSRSANTRSDNACARRTASSRDCPYVNTPGSSGTSAIQRPLVSCSTSSAYMSVILQAHVSGRRGRGTLQTIMLSTENDSNCGESSRSRSCRPSENCSRSVVELSIETSAIVAPNRSTKAQNFSDLPSCRQTSITSPLVARSSHRDQIETRPVG